MPSTRSSARQSGAAPASSPASATKASPKTSSGGGTKRKAAADQDGSSPSAAKSKRGRPSAGSGEKEQKTLEEVVKGGESEEKKQENGGDVEMQDGEEQNGKAEEKGESKAEETNGESKADEKEEPKADEKEESKATNGEEKTATQNGDTEAKKDEGANALDKVKADAGDAGTTSKANEEEKKEDASLAQASKQEAVEEDSQREAAMPSNILEKGVIYFFTRGRVGVEDPDSVQDLARSYFVMRPLPDGAKITDGAIQDLKNNRLVALPKKVWPKSGKDRFMCFVEKAATSNQTLKEEFYSGSEYSTQTVGTRQQPEVTPLGEGVYAFTSTGGGQGTTHLAYMLTIPQQVSDVQKDVGLEAKGSFVVSLKNPESSGPANAQLPQGPDYPKEFIEEFRGRGWMPAHPKHLDYANAQMLLIGEDFENSGNLEPAAKDERDGEKETPGEELEKLEKEDEERVENFKGDDSIFADLGISSKDYPKVKTTW